ncbi:hypothetical protein CLV98_102442 [Dyadobacter jejuensis]|uniref:Uncharacterized protein n=1 Tax=Dyadobacter jejuensis TaxID=1082580 RepID=A0A316AQ39_9BACT|nr:hypothetical protein CLV98_102442 [Dyadobacter jejuensis]
MYFFNFYKVNQPPSARQQRGWYFMAKELGLSNEFSFIYNVVVSIEIIYISIDFVNRIIGIISYMILLLLILGFPFRE